MDRLRVVAQPWELGHLVAVAEGAADLAYTVDGVVRTARFESDNPRASFVFDERGLFQRASVALRALRVSAPANAEPIRAQRLEVHARNGYSAGVPAHDVAVRVNDVELGENGPPFPGPHVAQAVIEATWKGRLSGSGDLGAALSAWRDAGGTLEINEIDIDWGEVSLHGTGTLALDEAMRPLGAATVTVGGFVPLIESIAAAGHLSSEEATAAKIALTLLSRRTENGSRVIELPARAQDGVVALGPVPVAHLAPVVAAPSPQP